VNRVEHITFSGAFAGHGQEVLYITERRSSDWGAGLRSSSCPGIEIDRDILPHMGFAPRIGPIRPCPPSLSPD